MLRLLLQLRQFRKAANPTPDFTLKLWTRLSEQIGAASDVSCSHSRWRWVWVATASCVFLLTMGTGVYAYESPAVVNGHPLYVVKNSLERVEGTFARTPEGRTRYHARMASRRLEEGEYHLKNRTQIEHALEAAASQMEFSVDELTAGLEDAEKRNEILDELSISHARYLELMSRVQDSEEASQGSDQSLPAPALRLRLQERGLSPEEQIRLFRVRRHATDSE